LRHFGEDFTDLDRDEAAERLLARPSAAAAEIRLHMDLGKPSLTPWCSAMRRATRCCPTLTRRWQDVRAARGRPQVMFHALRHTHPSALIAVGIDVVKVGRRLGHTDPTATLRNFAHLQRWTRLQLAQSNLRLPKALVHGDRRLPVPIRVSF